MMVLNIENEAIKELYKNVKNFDIGSYLRGDKNQISYQQLKDKSLVDPLGYKIVYQDSLKVKNQIDLLSSYIRYLRKEINEKAKIKKENPYDDKKIMTSYYLGDLFFYKNKPTKKTIYLKELINKFRVFSLNHYPLMEDKKRVENLFNTNSSYKNHSWEKEKFFNRPLAFIVNYLSKLEMDLKNEEAFLITSILSKKLKKEPLDGAHVFIKAPIIIKKGEVSRAHIILDGGNFFPFYVRFKQKDFFVDNHLFSLEMDSSTSGEKQMEGEVYFLNEKGEKKSYFFKHSYNVQESYQGLSKGVLSAQKMNILYRGIENPMIASIPGVSPYRLSLEASHGELFFKEPGKWTYRPGKGKEVIFSLKGKDAYGKEMFLEKIPFRIKDIPPPRGVLRGEMEPRIPLSSLIKSKVGVIVPDFDFPLDIIVKSFVLKIPGKASILCQGNEFSLQAIKSMEGQMGGSSLILNNIEAYIKGQEYIKLKKIAPLLVFITN